MSPQLERILLLPTVSSLASIPYSHTRILFESKMASRLHASLPAPVVHAGFSVSQSKSHVLAGVQDAYWSDDDAVSDPYGVWGRSGHANRRDLS